AKSVDRRADIWAFGCVLYEMLTGKMAFRGETASEILAAILKNEPDWSLLPAETPMRVRVLLQRCLQKDPKQRLRDIRDARISLDEILAGATDAQAGPVTPYAAPRWKLWLAPAIAVALTAVSVSLAFLYFRSTPLPSAQITRFDVALPEGTASRGGVAL